MDRSDICDSISRLKKHCQENGVTKEFDVMVSESMAKMLFPEGHTSSATRINGADWLIWGIIDDCRILTKSPE